MKKLTLTALIAALPFLTFAHEGHGEFPHNTPWHYVFSFWHIVPVLLMVALIIYAVRKYAFRDKTSIK